MAITISLDKKMQEIVNDAIEDGLASDPQGIVRLALQDFWGNYLLRGYTPEELRRIGEEAIADTRPGRPAEEVFADLEAMCQQLDEKQRSLNAA